MAKTKKAKLPGEEMLKNPKHELFSWLYAGSHNRDLFGNGTRCYIHVFFSAEIEKLQDEIVKLLDNKDDGYTRLVAVREARIKSLETQARTRAAELVANRGISARISYLMDQLISHEFMDRELTFVAGQRFDLNSKVQAIKEYNRLNDRGKVGNLEGSFTFSWEETKPNDTGTKKKPVLKKAEVKQKESVVEWGE